MVKRRLLSHALMTFVWPAGEGVKVIVVLRNARRRVMEKWDYKKFEVGSSLSF